MAYLQSADSIDPIAWESALRAQPDFGIPVGVDIAWFDLQCFEKDGEASVPRHEC